MMVSVVAVFHKEQQGKKAEAQKRKAERAADPNDKDDAADRDADSSVIKDDVKPEEDDEVEEEPNEPAKKEADDDEEDDNDDEVDKNDS